MLASISLINAPLSVVLATFSDVAERQYLTDIDDAERINWITQQSLTPDQAHAALEAVIATIGLEAVASRDGVYRIQTLVTRTPPELRPGPENLKLSIQAIQALIAQDPALTGVQVIPGVNGGVLSLLGQTEQLNRLSRSFQPFTQPTPSPVQAVPADSGARPASRVIDLKHARAGDIVEALAPITSDTGDLPGGRLAAINDTNQVILIGATPWIDLVAPAIAKLDRAPRQVFVDAIIAEVSDSTTRRLGLQFSGRAGDIGLVLAGGLEGAAIGNVAQSSVLQGVTGGLASIGASRALPDLGLLLAALQADSETNILATPSLMAIENRSSEILVGQNVPLLTGSYSNDNGGGAPFQTIRREDLGTILRILPRISAEGDILLEVEQEVSRVDASATGLADIATVKRQIKTVVSAQPGQTVAIGGLRDVTIESAETRVPGLGSIPIIGKVFRSTSERQVTRNLLVFLRPSRDANVASQRLIDQFPNPALLDDSTRPVR